MNEIREMWLNKNEHQIRIDLTIFFVNIFLLLCHIFLMIIYILAGHKFMIFVNLISILVYIKYLFSCYKNINGYTNVSFVEIWLHMLFAILSFGWTPCFQNWSFALITAYFLPAFSENKNYTTKKAFIFAFVMIFTYFFAAITKDIINYKIMVPLDDILKRILFVANNAFVFFSIIMFAQFYTRSSIRKENELTRKADHDELTNLYNRYALNELSKNIINESNCKYSVAILDIDYFKKVNDTYGHNSGDMVLKSLANILLTYSTNGIICGRWGGEEFLLIAPDTIPYAEFITILEKLRIKVSKTKFTIENKKKINITISIGSTNVTDKSLEEAVSDADTNLYEAKETGRNKLVS